MPTTGRSLRMLLPREHGAWCLAFEPLALGLLAAPSRAGGCLALAATAMFFARRPLHGLLRPRETAPRTASAPLLLGLALLAAAALGAAATLASWAALWPLLLAVPPAVLFVVCDAQGEARAVSAELAGAAAFAVLPAACATLAGHHWSVALALATSMLLRAMPAVLVVRSFLRRRKGHTGSGLPALVASAAAAVVITALALADLASGAALGAAFLFLLRAVWLLGPAAPSLRAPQLGALEATLGAGFVLAVGLA